jgi:CubicO group peptidase (beta-lactamase class C family)
LTVGAFKSVVPEFSHDFDPDPSVVKRWGLATMIYEEPSATGLSAGSIGWAGVLNTFFWVDFERRIAGVMLTQTLPFARPEVLQLFGDFQAATYDQFVGQT